MAEQLLNVVDACPLVEKLGCKGPSKGVEYYPLSPIINVLVEKVVDHALKGLRDLLLLVAVLVGENRILREFPLAAFFSQTWP